MSDFDDILTCFPSLAKLINTYGSMSLFEYAQKNYFIKESDTILFQERKNALLTFLDEYVTKKFGQKSAEIVTDALCRNYAVSTAEHHGPMGHSFFFQSALLRAITQPDLAVINFATSHVSLGNSSYPRGLVFHGDGEKAPKEYLHLPFFSSKLRMSPVFALPAYTREDIYEHCIKRLQHYYKEQGISEKMYESILEFIYQTVLNPSILGLNTYSEQITQLNHIWWGELFPEMPKYISLDAEDLTVELLKIHLQEKSFFSQLLTDIALQPRIEVEFDGISCCFDRKTSKGTYLFWYLDEHHRRHALWREGDELMSSDKSFRIKMISEEYMYHLKEHHLIPSGLLVYTMFACYYGVTCFGGFAQGEYLSLIQNAFKKFVEKRDQIPTQASILNEDMVFLLQKNGEISTALDLYGDFQEKNILEITHTILLSDSLYKMESEISRCLT